MSILLDYTETNCPDTFLNITSVTNSTLSSSAVNELPSSVDIVNASTDDFVYNNFNLTNSSPDLSDLILYDIEYGMTGDLRYGIGYFSFFIPNEAIPFVQLPVQEDLFDKNLWGYLTTFWDYLNESDRLLFENYWQGTYLAANDLTSKAQRMKDASAPECANESPIENYYEIAVSPLTSKPLYPDPTDRNSNYIINPIDKILVEPEYDVDRNPVYRDMISISAKDYYNIRDVGLDAYLVVHVNQSGISDKYFPIYNLLSSDESVGRPQYAEMNRSFNNRLVPIDSSLIGTIALQGFHNLGDPDYVDISQYNVQISETTGYTTIAWTEDSLFIQVGTSEGNQIEAIFSAEATQTGDPWATLIDKSAGRTKAPIFGGTSLGVFSVNFNDLPNFRCAESTSPRYYRPNGLVWQWYDTYNPALGLDPLTTPTGSGEYVPNPAMKNYLIVVDGDLSYINSNSFNIYLTTGRSYDVDKYIIDLQYLHTHITAGYTIEFLKNRDYSFNNSIVEFKNDIFKNNEVSVGDILYCQKAPAIEYFLYEMFGPLIGMSDWVAYNHTNISGKTAINSIVSSLQNTSSIGNYNLAMNAYYGLPISPKDGRIDGLYESYSYQIINININTLTLNLKPNQVLHPFIQANGTFFVEGKYGVSIVSVDNRLSGAVTVSDASNLKTGDMLNIKLRNNFTLLSVGVESGSEPAFVTVYCPEGAGAIQHIIDVVYQTSNQKIYPEIFIYNTTHPTVNYNGVYHITQAVATGNPSDHIVKLKLYKKPDNADPLYNDYIGVSINNIIGGKVHLIWPTHKFLNIQFNDGTFFKAYLDAPIDTILDSEDVVSKYQILSRNASTLTKSMFPGWFEYDQFRRYCGISFESDTLEATKEFKYAQYGKYFPSDFSANSIINPVSAIEMLQNTYNIDGSELVQDTFVPHYIRKSGLPDWQSTYSQGE